MRGIRKSINDPSDTPGPGNYSMIKPEVGPSYSMRPKVCLERKVINPGPGDYSPKGQDQAHTWHIGRSSRDAGSFLDRQSKAGPGPGSYGEKKPGSGPKWCFGSSKREKTSDPVVPGPGHYKLLPVIGN